ncbi:unnamed protein product [Chironomus riparius]|uniref:Uncharacterized protein n=1 Tax=Chironomus riparius TaxID=315576 RepID=A0A9N9RK97_9DIPT|nr:unnamed protein product [Chironomus riparius]
MELKVYVLILIVLLSLIQTAFSVCNYRTDNFYGYMCDFKIHNPNGQNNFTDIVGWHSWFRGDGNVQATIVMSGSYSINFPAVICNKFYNNIWINLSSIGIKFIDYFALRSCKNLQYLDLDNNKITDINEMSFIYNLDMRTLLLYSNQLSTLPESVFGKLKKLTTLKLNNNKLTQLPQNIFNETKALKDLNLDDNLIESLPSNIFKSLNNLQVLRMSNNKITSILPDWFKTLGNLLTLYLEGNKIEQLPVNAFNSLKKVTKISLIRNNLKIIHSDSFGILPSLTHIYLQNNVINGFYEKIIDNTKVHTLDMFNNLCANVNIFDNSTDKESMRTTMGKCFDNYEITVFGCISGNLDARMCKLEGENEKTLASFQKIDNQTNQIVSQADQLIKEIKTLKLDTQGLHLSVEKLTIDQKVLSKNFTSFSTENQKHRDTFEAKMEAFMLESSDKSILMAENQEEIEKLHALINELKVFVNNQSSGYEELHNQVLDLMARPCECHQLN